MRPSCCTIVGVNLCIKINMMSTQNSFKKSKHTFKKVLGRLLISNVKLCVRVADLTYKWRDGLFVSFFLHPYMDFLSFLQTKLINW